VGRDGCLACDLSEGRRPLPGGLIHAVAGWRVEHCVGPLGLGTLIVKPTRHVEHVADLTADEAGALGPLLKETARVVGGLCAAEQVYVCCWSHGPVHVHFVVQPETEAATRAFGAHGPGLQLAQFERGAVPPPDQVDQFAAAARQGFAEPDGG
jgi:diadenosine tetraphosphate (Ap4A) HIT family hydrolase